MNKVFNQIPNAWKEFLFQALLHLVVFIFYAISRRNPAIEEFEVVFFLNPALLALGINYLLLGRFFYTKKYLTFTALLLVLIAASVVVEEYVLEQIYFPTTRGSHFSAVFYTLLSILPATTILVGGKFGWDAFRKQREVDELKVAIRESELQFLKSQINPHFLFNNMNNLYAHAIEQSPKTPEIILELSSVLRYMLYDCKEKEVSLDREIEQLKNYVGISELQIGERGKVRIEAESEGQGFRIAPLLLIVFVENAFKHSTASQSEDILIDIRIEVNPAGELTFTCVNSFEMQTNVDDLAHGIGLDNVRKRLQLLYPDNHRLTISQEQTRFRVELTLQLNQIS